MKKYFEVVPGVNGLKDRVVMVKEDDKSNVYIILAVIATVLAVVALGVVILTKNKSDEDYEDSWDYDWDDLEDDFYDAESEECCCCDDEDVDKDVKIEEI